MAAQKISKHLSPGEKRPADAGESWPGSYGLEDTMSKHYAANGKKQKKRPSEEGQLASCAEIIQPMRSNQHC